MPHIVLDRILERKEKETLLGQLVKYECYHYISAYFLVGELYEGNIGKFYLEGKNKCSSVLVWDSRT